MRVAPDRPDHSENVGVALSQNPITAVTAATVTLYSADGLIAVQEEHDGVTADVPIVVGSAAGDDDLTSLTWLQDKNLLKSVHELPKHEFIDDGAGDSSLSNNSASNSSSRKTTNQCINVIPRLSYDPQVHVDSKPPFSFSCLIFMAIEDSDEKALPVKDIYVWILDHFPYYRNAPTGWKNSVRHNLSLNKCFKKVEKSPHLGKGSLWMVEQRFRPCLIQALQKTPHHQYHKFIRNLNIKKPPLESTTNACDKTDVKLLASDEVEVAPKSSKNMKSETSCIKENLDDVDAAAATAMLVLKHGGYAFDIKSENVGLVLRNDKVVAGGLGIIEVKSESTNCLNDDHNYGFQSMKLNSASGADLLPNEKETMNSYWSTNREDIEEQRKIVEGADALLNLAGIKTTTHNTKKRGASALVDEQPYRYATQLCAEQSSFFKARLVRQQEQSSIDINSHESIHFLDTNACSDSSNDHGSTSEMDDVDPLKVHRIKPRSRATVVNNRRLRKKLEKKRIKL